MIYVYACTLKNLKMNEKIILLEDATRIERTNLRAYYALGCLYVCQRDYYKARDNFKRVQELNKDYLLTNTAVSRIDKVFKRNK